MPPNEPVLATRLRQNSRSITKDWAAHLKRRTRRSDGDGLVQAEFTERYLPAILDTLAQLIERPSPELVAVYRDELQRYILQLGHPLDSKHGNVLGFDVPELVMALRTALSDHFGPSRLLETLDGLHEPLLSPPDRRYNMLLLGDCLMNGIRCFLGEDLRRRGIDLNGYHQYFSAALSAPFRLAIAREFVTDQPVGVIAFSPFTYDGLPIFRQLLMDRSSAPEGITIDAVLDVVGHTVEDIRSWSNAQILLHNACGVPAGPERASITSLPPLTSDHLSIINTLNTALQERMANWSGVTLVDEAAVVARIGLREASKPAVTGVAALESLNHTSRLGRELARSYASILEAAATARLRALAVDFDGTLWCGVMAEGAVTHYRDRQALLRRLAHQGIVLIGLSRGAPETIRWSEVDLTPDDFVVVKRTWRPKQTSLGEVLHTLGIRPEHVGIVDDDASERAMLVNAFPDLSIFDADDPAVWQSLARAADMCIVTGDGARRTERYQTALRRDHFVSEQANTRITTNAMAALCLRMSYRPMRPGDVARTHELLRRTNQFNTTGITLSTRNLTNTAHQPAAYAVRVACLRDRFGDFGLIAAVIVHQERRSIESFVLSCRAMGYGVEHVLLDRVIAEYGAPIEARLVRTRLNEPCHGLYALAGFYERAPGYWRLDRYQPTHILAPVTVEASDCDE